MADTCYHDILFVRLKLLSIMPPPSNKNKSNTRHQSVDTFLRKGAHSEEIETPLEPQNENEQFDPSSHNQINRRSEGRY